MMSTRLVRAPDITRSERQTQTVTVVGIPVTGKSEIGKVTGTESRVAVTQAGGDCGEAVSGYRVSLWGW